MYKLIIQKVDEPASKYGQSFKYMIISSDSPDFKIGKRIDYCGIENALNKGLLIEIHP